jgi:hypothetical protein
MLPREIVAGAIVAAVVGAEYAEAKDVRGAPAGTRDFDLVFSDGHVEPLEATTVADDAVIGTSQRMSRLDRDSPSLSRIWTIHMPSSEVGPDGVARQTAVLEFHSRAEKLLRRLEEEGCHEFDVRRQWPSDPSLAATFRSLAKIGSIWGNSFDLPRGRVGRVYVFIESGGWADPDGIAASVESAALAGNTITNADKLREPRGAQRRHLFVQIHSSDAHAFFAVEETTRSRIPELPDPITTAWVFGGGNSVFAVTPPGAWEHHEISADVLEHPDRFVRMRGRAA